MVAGTWQLTILGLASFLVNCYVPMTVPMTTMTTLTKGENKMGFLKKLFSRKNSVNAGTGNETISFSDSFHKIAANSIELQFDKADLEQILKGSSKFGGKPDLPENFQWPYFEGINFDGERKNRPLSFILQINCTEMKQYDTDNKLPDKGMLYFFYELSTMTWGMSPDDKGSSKVYYFDIDATNLKEKDFPKDMENEYKLLEMRVSCHSKKDLPDYAEFDRYDYDIKRMRRYMDEKEDFLGLGKDYDGNISKLLGYANLIQGDLLFRCEGVSNGYVYYSDFEKLEARTRKKIEDASSEWTLLLQLQSVESINANDFELVFGSGGGRIYYYIKKEDLKNKKFENVHLILECT